jgi:hypothetical protein
MADFMNEQEIQDAMARLAENFRLGYITAEEYNKGMKDATVGIRGYTANLRSSMAQLGTSFKQLGKDIYDGKQGAAVFNNTMDAGANAVAAYALKFGPAGIALGAFTKAVTSFVGAANKQSDLLFESYQKISRAGAVGAGAMSEVFDNMLKLGYTQDQLGNLNELLARNSKNFGVFFQSALQGSRALGNVANQIQNSPLRQQFFNLGMSVDDINDGIAGFVNQQGKLGQVQGKSVDQLAKGAEAYIKELDVLTKLTGLTRQEQEEAREQALQIEAFYAGLADLGPRQQEEALKAFTYAYAKGGPKMAAEMAASFNGVLTAGSDMFLSTGGASMEYFSKNFFAKGGTFEQSMDGVRQSVTPQMMDITKELNQIGAGFGMNLRSLTMFTRDGVDPLAKIMDQLTDEQYKQLTGMDKATAAQSKVRDNQIKTAQNLQEFVNLGVNPATSALELFTSALETLTSFIPGAGRAKARRDEEVARKTGRETATTRAEAAYQTGTGAMGFEFGSMDAGGGAEPPAVPAVPADLKLKPGAENRGKSSDMLYGVAEQVHKMLGGDYKYFSGFNDRGGKSKHAEGRAFDLVLNDANKYESVLSQIKSIKGVSFAQFEPKGHVNPNGSISSGDHIHTEVSAAQGAILSGPMGGYQPNLTMHGTEAVIPLNTAAQQAAAGVVDNGVMSAQLSRLEEMVSLMKSQLNVSTKIMQYSS